MPVGAISVLCAQLTRDLLAIAKFLFLYTCTALTKTADINMLLKQVFCVSAVLYLRRRRPALKIKLSVTKHSWNVPKIIRISFKDVSNQTK